MLAEGDWKSDHDATETEIGKLEFGTVGGLQSYQNVLFSKKSYLKIRLVAAELVVQEITSVGEK